MYDPSIARWNAIDPLAAVYNHLNPYHYVSNNPLPFIDIGGYGQYNLNSPQRYNPDPNPYRDASLAIQVRSDLTSLHPGNDRSGPNDPPSANPNSGLTLAFPNPDIGTLGSGITLYNGSLRMRYMVQTYRLAPLWQLEDGGKIQTAYNLRHKYKGDARRAMIFSRSLANVLNNHPSTANRLLIHHPGTIPTRFFLSHEGWNLAGAGGIVLGTAGLLYSARNIANEEDQLNQGAIEIGSFAGAWAGGEYGAALGSPLGPWGSVGGGLIFGAIGAYGGSKTADNLYKKGRSSANELWSEIKTTIVKPIMDLFNTEISEIMRGYMPSNVNP